MTDIRTYVKSIAAGENVRQNLTLLNSAISDEKAARTLMYVLGGDFSLFLRLLKDEDPKVRKNAAKILGETENEDVLPALAAAWEKEETLFVRADYLKAMEKLDCREYLPLLKSRYRQIRTLLYGENGEGGSVPAESEKHLIAELRELSSLIAKAEKPKKHVFRQWDPAPELILITNRLHPEVTLEAIESGESAVYGKTVKVKGGNLREILKVRTWSEMLFPLQPVKPVRGNAAECAEALGASQAASFLEGLHEPDPAPFRYRIEMKERKAAQTDTAAAGRKGAGSSAARQASAAAGSRGDGEFIRRLGVEIDRQSGGRLENSSSDYEAEIRLVEKKDGSYIPMLKLFTISDRRFTYRKEFTAASMAPVNAALTCALVKPYLKEGAQILDPFCGVGTLLTERMQLVKARSAYGVDILAEAIEKARKNAERAALPVNYINRDFFDFTHEYLFDEIITQLPNCTEQERNREITEKFLRKTLSVTADHAILIIWTSSPAILKSSADRIPEYRLRETFLISEKSGATVFVLEKEK